MWNSRTAVDISVLIATKNEGANLARCLQSVESVREAIVVDSGSTDSTLEIAAHHGARVVTYRQQGDWPKKRQWAFENLSFLGSWVLVLDADESITPRLMDEIAIAIQNPSLDGYRARLSLVFMGRTLRYGGNQLWKTILFRRGRAHYERRLPGEDLSGYDIEIHDHLIVHGRSASLRNAVLHYDCRSISEYLERHNRYSTWDAQVFKCGSEGLAPLWRCRSTVDLRRWLKRRMLSSWWLWLAVFLYRYVCRVGFLDGAAGTAYCWLQAIQVLHTRIKIEAMRRDRDLEADSAERATSTYT